jgi:hypothetical protein
VLLAPFSSISQFSFSALGCHTLIMPCPVHGSHPKSPWLPRRSLQQTCAAVRSDSQLSEKSCVIQPVSVRRRRGHQLHSLTYSAHESSFLNK